MRMKESSFPARWQSPAAPKEGVWGAFDCSGKVGQYNLLYFDSNLNNDLTDEMPIMPGYTSERGNFYLAYFKQVEVVLRPHQIHVPFPGGGL